MAATKTPTPKAQRKAWVKALRSGEYKKGTGALGNKKNGYCCLGVGCKVTNTRFNAFDIDSDRLSDKVGLSTHYGGFTPTKKLVKWLDARANEANKDTPGYVKNPATRYASEKFRQKKLSLVLLNDELKLPFNVIAEVIEQEPEGLFKDG